MLNVPTVYQPILETSTKVLKVGPVPIGSSGNGTVLLTNFNGCHLHVFDIRLSESTDPTFDLPTLPRVPMLVRSEESVGIQVRFRPDRAGCASGSLEISSDDPARPLARVALYGTGA